MNKLEESITQSLEKLEIDWYTFEYAISLIKWNIEEIITYGNIESTQEAKSYISFLLNNKNISLDYLESLKDKIISSNENETESIQYFLDNINGIIKKFTDEKSQNNWHEYIREWNITWIIRYKSDGISYLSNVKELYNYTSQDICHLSSILDTDENSEFEFELWEVTMQKWTLH